eukprot:366171-Chlamydomonas_euryale.AAC.5
MFCPTERKNRHSLPQVRGRRGPRGGGEAGGARGAAARAGSGGAHGAGGADAGTSGVTQLFAGRMHSSSGAIIVGPACIWHVRQCSGQSRCIWRGCYAQHTWRGCHARCTWGGCFAVTITRMGKP